jgi:hypothetical protein
MKFCRLNSPPRDLLSSKNTPRSSCRPAGGIVQCFPSAHWAAVALLEEAQTPLRWLQAPVDELAHVDRRLTEIDRETEAAVDKWIADGSVGERRDGGTTGIADRSSGMSTGGPSSNGGVLAKRLCAHHCRG